MKARDFDNLLDLAADIMGGSARSELAELRRYSRGSALAGNAMAQLLGATRGRLGGLLNQLSAIVSGESRGRNLNPRQLDVAKKLLQEAGYDIFPKTRRRGDMIQPPPLPDDPRTARRQGGNVAAPPIMAPPVAPSLEGRDFGGRGVPALPRPGEELPYGEETLAPSSSNVYSFSFMGESRTSGSLYVTFKATASKGQSRPNAAGPTYAYFDVPVSVYTGMRRAASKGEYVWDALRIRGTVYGHQYQYRLVSAELRPNKGGTSLEQYIPRKATQKGFKTRSLAAVGKGKRGFRQSSLPEQSFRSRSPGRTGLTGLQGMG